MEDDRFWYLLFTELLARSPKDTRNMVNNITVADMGDFWKVTISGPSMTSQGFYDYAMAVNYNQQRTAKEARNYKWIERTIRQVAEAMGGTVKYEL